MYTHWERSSQPQITPPSKVRVAQLLEKKWFRRVISVTCDQRTFVLRYNGWGLGTEYVYVDGELAIRRGRNSLSMSHAFRFVLGDEYVASLSIAIPWWCDLVPLCDLTFVRLEIDGTVIYEEGSAPKRPLKWTSAGVGGFPVICNSQPFH